LYKNKIFLNCQFASIQSSGGAGKYVASLIKEAQNLDELRQYSFLCDNLSEQNSHRSGKIISYGKKIVNSVLPRPALKVVVDVYKKRQREILYANDLNSKGKVDILSTNDLNSKGKVLLHEVTNYATHKMVGRMVTRPNFKMLSTFLDIQDYYYPDFFSDETLSSRRLTYSFLKEYCDHFIAISHHTKKSMVDRLSIPDNKISVVHLAADVPEIYEDHSFKRKIISLGKYLVYPAKPWAHKNHRMLVSCIGDMKDKFKSSSRKVVLCGGFSSSEMRLLQAEIKEHNVEDIIHVAGFLSSNQLSMLIAHAEYMIFPSLFEGFGMPPIEAMALGCPVLSSTAGSLPEVCGNAAVFFEPQSKGAINAILEDALAEKIDRSSLIYKGYINSKRFSWKKCANETFEVYKQLLS
jgi:glycosyltransferase involved in cell wall biosynthesis